MGKRTHCFSYAKIPSSILFRNTMSVHLIEYSTLSNIKSHCLDNDYIPFSCYVDSVKIHVFHLFSLFVTITQPFHFLSDCTFL